MDVAPMTDGLGFAAFKAVLALVLVLAAIVVSAWAARRVRGGLSAAPGWFRIRASAMLGTRERIVLVEAAGAHLLLAVSPGQVRVLHTYDQAPSLPEAEFAAGSFAARLRELGARRGES
jgi:flagellar protein FliO/FliZ